MRTCSTLIGALGGVAPAPALAVVALLTGGQPAAAATGDPDRGAQVFGSCAACHSLAPDEHRTGPSLAGIFGRAAGTVAGFTRYSPALEQADLTWTEQTLDAWLANPQAMIPGNRMTFPGIGDDQARADLIAYLQAATADGSRAGGSAATSPDMPDLGALGPDQQVARSATAATPITSPPPRGRRSRCGSSTSVSRRIRVTRAHAAGGPPSWPRA